MNAHGVISEPSLNDHIGKGREGKGGEIGHHSISSPEADTLFALEPTPLLGKTCRQCMRALPAASFNRSTNEKDGLQPYCKECKRAYNTENRENINARQRRYLRKWRPKKRGPLTSDQYDQLLAEQGGVCAICLLPETVSSRYGDVLRLAIDHCHETGAIRGLLCRSCNVGLGCYRDSPELLEAAIGYLASPPALILSATDRRTQLPAAPVHAHSLMDDKQQRGWA